MKRTPLYEQHVRAGGKMIDFGGWELPVQYTGIVEEHRRVRSAAGLFDVSHMGEISVTGKDAGHFLNRMLTNSIDGGQRGRVVYSPMCYPDGGVVDDLVVYIFDESSYLLVVNAANTQKDFQWLKENSRGEAEIRDISGEYAQIAIQGPGSVQILQKLTRTDLTGLKFFRFSAGLDLCGAKALISRTGYTGEDGFEIYVSPESSGAVWEALLEAGGAEGLVPAGLGARDTLRFEAALPLYGHELSGEISPLEAGLHRFVKLDKESFTGREALRRQAEKGTERRLAGLEMVDRGIPRSGYEVYANGAPVGIITTGNYSPTLGKNLGLALLGSNYASVDTEVEVVVRNSPLKAKVAPLPFYRKRYVK